MQMQELMNKAGGNNELEAWDWFYYADKVRKEILQLSLETELDIVSLQSETDSLESILCLPG